MKPDDITGKKPFDHKAPRAGVYPFYIDEDGAAQVYLMIPSKEKYGGKLPQMGKGGIEEGETAEAAAMREGHEELGLLASNVKNIYELADQRVPTSRGGYQLTVFVAEVFDPNDFEPHGYEAKWSGWVELDEAIKMSRKTQRVFLEMLRDREDVTD